MKTLLTQHPVNEQYQSNSGVNTVALCLTILGIVEVYSHNEAKIIVDSEKRGYKSRIYSIPHEEHGGCQI